MIDSNIISAADETTEGAFHMVQGMSRLMQPVLGENRRLTKVVCDLQAENARLRLVILNQGIEMDQLDDTVVSLLNARSRR